MGWATTRVAPTGNDNAILGDHRGWATHGSPLRDGGPDRVIAAVIDPGCAMRQGGLAGAVNINDVDIGADRLGGGFRSAEL